MWRKLAVLACLALGASAQEAISNATSGPWTAELDGVWRWLEGDNLAWASPTFDDSTWPRLAVPVPAQVQIDTGFAFPCGWDRSRISNEHRDSQRSPLQRSGFY